MKAVVRDNKDILEMFESQLTRSEDKFSSLKKNCQEDNDFSLGKQWDAGSIAERSVPGAERPLITVNKIDPLVHRIVNEAKQEKLEAIVKAGNDTTDPDAALVLGGMIRRIQYMSKATRAYMWAYECAVRAGVGYYKVMNKYESEDSFDQTIVISRIKDPNTISFDPDSEDLAGRDAQFCIESSEISKQYAVNLMQEVDYDPKDLIGRTTNIWELSSDGIREGKIQWMEMFPDELIELADRSVVKKSAIAPEQYKILKATPNMIRQIRKIQGKKVRYAHLIDGKVIENIPSVSNRISYIRMVGREGYIDGETDFRGITRNSKDANRMYNVMSSLIVERIGLSPRAPYIGAAGQFEGFELQWANANRVNLPKLEYIPVSLNGVPLPPPMKNDAPSGDATTERYLMITANDIKDTSSISDAFMGNRSNETTGVAIKARSSQSGLATYDFLDNCHDAIEYGMSIVLEMIPKTHKGRRVVQILGEDMEEKVINLDAFAQDNGEFKVIDFESGKFSMEISVSSGDKTRRETAIEQLAFVLQTNPDAASLIMDVFVSNLDIKDAKKIANRFKSLLPPAVIAAENDQEKDNPELDAMEQHASEIISQLKASFEECKAALEQAQKELADKTRELDIKQQEADVKKTEASTHELIAFTQRKAQAAKDGEEGKKDEGEEASETAKLVTIVKSLQETKEELDLVHKQIDQITEILAKSAPAQQESTPPADASTEGNGLPPAEAANNVGAI